MDPGERVKPRLFQALTRDARSDSNSRPAVQISSPLSSYYAPWEHWQVTPTWKSCLPYSTFDLKIVTQNLKFKPFKMQRKHIGQMGSSSKTKFSLKFSLKFSNWNYPTNSENHLVQLFQDGFYPYFWIIIG
jgi:hypothetical protein